MSELRRERWFVEGAAALRRTLTAEGLSHILPTPGEFYACPCCLWAHGPAALETGALTDEHVPPRAAGGRPLLLTCVDCNNTAGSMLDAHAERREAIHDLLAGRASGRPLRAHIGIGNTIIQGRIHLGDDAFLLEGVPKANNPKDLDEATRTLEAWAAGEATDGRIGFKFDENLSVEQARLSWVRAAYLAAFAALGWRYALLRRLNPLRAQLATPQERLLPSVVTIDPTASWERRQLLVVQEPKKMRSLAVVLGRQTVFLPSPEAPQSFEALSAALARLYALPPPRPQFTGKAIPWPAEPQYALDR